jgi:hypothetical protein
MKTADRPRMSVRSLTNPSYFLLTLRGLYRYADLDSLMIGCDLSWGSVVQCVVENMFRANRNESEQAFAAGEPSGQFRN